MFVTAPHCQAISLRVDMQLIDNMILVHDGPVIKGYLAISNM